MRILKLWERTAGRPPRCRALRPSTSRASSDPESMGTRGFTHRSRSAPWPRATVECRVFRRTPSTQTRPSTSTGWYRPGTAVLACTAREMGMWSSPPWPKTTAPPVSRSVATTKNFRGRFRKSSVLPGCRKARRRYSRMASLSKRHTGSEGPSPSRLPMKEGLSVPFRNCSRASPMTQGRRNPRLRSSPKAGMKKMAGSKRTSWPGSPRRPRSISVTVIPLTRWDPTKAPALTPT